MPLYFVDFALKIELINGMARWRGSHLVGFGDGRCSQPYSHKQRGYLNL